MSSPGQRLPELRQLLSTSVTGKDITGAKLLIYSECLRWEWPDGLAELADGRVALSVCLERDHMNHITVKIATIMVMARPAEIVALTADGSPGCVQVHFALRQALRITGLAIPVRHLVVEKGRLYEIEPRVVRIARHLSEVQALATKPPGSEQ